MKRLLILCFFICSLANAATFRKGESSSFTKAGATGSYSINPLSNGSPGTILSPNVGWLPVPNSPSPVLQKIERLPFPSTRQLEVNAKVVATPKGLSRALVNPWAFVATYALQQALDSIADAACVRIAGGQMVNTGGLWEECKIKQEIQPVYSCSYGGRTAESPDFKKAAETCLPFDTKDPYGNTYKGFSHILRDSCGAGCHSAMFNRQDYGSTTTQLVGPFALYEQQKLADKKVWEPTSTENAVTKVEQHLNANPELSPQIFQELYLNDVPVEIYTPNIVGPLTALANDPVTTNYSITNSNINNSTSPTTTNYTKTVTTTNHYTYTNNTVTITNQTITTTIINNTTNEVTTETKDQPLEASEDFCTKKPDSITCQDINLDSPDGEIPRSTFDLTYQEESFLSGGSCPADVYVNVGGKQVLAIDWQSHCNNIVNYLSQTEKVHRVRSPS